MNFFDWLNRTFEGESHSQEDEDTVVDATSGASGLAPIVQVLLKPQPRHYTAEDVWRDMAEMAMLFIADIQQEMERHELPMAMRKDDELLSEFGLVNSRNARIIASTQKEVEANNKEYDRKKAALAFMQEVWEKFGKDAMVVRYDHFFKILEKYDLVCGALDRYTGAIPAEAMAVLGGLRDRWAKGDFPSRFGMEVCYTESITLCDAEADNIRLLRANARMPFIVLEESVMREIERLTSFECVDDERDSFGGRTLNNVLFIAAPAADMSPLPVSISFDLPHGLSRSDFGSGWVYNQAVMRSKMGAEERMIALIESSDIPRYYQCDFIKTQPLPERIVEDPFICSLTSYGILIHAKWGAEAEDATIKRYEQLRDTIIGKGGGA